MKHGLLLGIALIVAGILVVGNAFAFRQELLGRVEKVVTYSYCDTPVRYRVENIDKKFGLSEDYLLEKSLQAASIWNLEMGEEFFIYDPKGELTISLVYDERQELTSQIGSLEDIVLNENIDLQTRIEQYEAKSIELNNRVDALNNEIKYWNNKGSAPPNEYDRIISQREQVNKEIVQLNKLADSLNEETQQINNKIRTYNSTVDTFNHTLEQKPEQGLYIGGENPQIEIYIYENEEELVHTIAHEFGHALGLDHLDDANAIMYPMTAKTTQLNSSDVKLLKEFCQKRNIVKEIVVDTGIF